MADIVWTEEALSDLEAIGDYFERSSPQYATTIVDRLYTSVEPLSEHPKMGRRVPEVDHESLRELIVEGYWTAVCGRRTAAQGAWAVLDD